MSGRATISHRAWPWPRRDRIIAQIGKRLSAARPRPTLVVGPLGSGKSFVLDSVGDELAARFGALRRLRGRPGLHRFGALLPQLPLNATPAETEWQLAHQLRQTLVPYGLDDPVLLVVDDLHLVDDDSLGVLLAAVEADGCVLLASAETTSPTASLADADIVTLDPLTDDELRSVINATVGPTDELTERGIRNAAAGNPLLLREVLNRAGAHPSFRTEDGLWSADPAILQPASIEMVLRERRSELSPSADRLLSMLAFTDALPASSLPQSDLQELRSTGWLDLSSHRLVFPDRLVAGTGGDEPRLLAEACLELVDQAEPSTVPARELVRWKRLVGDPVSDAELLGAARDAAAHWALGDALELAESVKVVNQETVLLCAELRARRGDLDGAAQLHERSIEMALTDHERVDALRRMADFRFFRRQRPDLALRAVTDAAPTIADPTAIVALEASVAMYAEMANDRVESARSRARVADIGDAAAPIARAEFVANVSFFDVMRGLLDPHPAWHEAAEEAERAEAVGESVGVGQRSLGLRLRLTEQLRRAAIGDLATAHQLATEGVAQVANGGPGLGVWLVTLADCARMAGDLPTAQRHLVSARRYLATDDDLGIGEIAQADLAGVLAEVGRPDRAKEVLAETGSDPDVFDPRAMGRIARAEVRLADDETCDERAVELAAITRDFGFVSWAAEVLYEAIRRDTAPRSTAMLGELTETYASELALDMVDFGRATIDQDVARLSDVASRLFTRGAENFAADAVAQAVGIAGDRWRLVPSHLVARARERARHASRTRALLDSGGVEVSDLTDREQEVAELAAERMSSKEIAEKLAISIRTVDNHLGAIYRKLGIASRQDLVDRNIGPRGRRRLES